MKSMQTDLGTALSELQALGNESVRERYRKAGAGANLYGVLLGDIRKLAAKRKNQHDLGLALWATGNLDARLLAILLLKPRDIAQGDLDAMVRDADFAQLADWLNSYIVKNHPARESLRESWMADANSWVARAGWSLTAGRVARSPEGLNLAALLDRLEAEMPGAAPETQWTMNNCLAAIGINVPQLRERAMAIGEALGIYRDYPVPKGCTSPFAPLWINEMVRRQETPG